MADVLLRESLDQLRAYLRSGRFADAFALGQHILHFYPKHVETYTVMAQLSLATNDLAGANDLLRRVLSADPENVVALAGMALISEVQDKYDEALWYLERAYEIQPSSDELRGELLRVREMFYGTAPARLELTAGALARVYARQGQYAQAINEFRRLLRNDSKRYDARVGLAEALYRAGRTDEAAQVAQAVMADAPYALKPNLILGALWTENLVPEGEKFLERAHQLDPEHRVARDLLGERFDGTQAPRVPAMGEGAVPAITARTEAAGGGISATGREASRSDGETLRASVFLSELERGQEPELSSDEALLADPDVLNRFDREQLEADRAAAVARILNESASAFDTAPAHHVVGSSLEQTPSTGATFTDATLQEILEAERIRGEQEKSIAPAPPVEEPDATPPPAEKPARTLGERLRRRSAESVSSDTIAAAATALATSIALDKTNQPSPTLRAHPSIPKVRPVIRGAQEKLPSWLRLSVTPSNAPASFDALPPSTADQITPIPKPPEERPEWLVQAEAASIQETITPQADTALPDWLKTPSAVESTSPVTLMPQEPVMPLWLRDETPMEKSRPVESAPNEAKPEVIALPEWLRDDTVTPQVAHASDDAPVVGDAVETAPRIETETRSEEPAPSTPAQVVPDSATMLEQARDKRAKGDLKGALDLYERVMHRRPNHLEQVTADLQAIVQEGAAPPTANRLLGEAYAMVGRFKESLEQYRIAMGK